jgi:hypothetical protein
MTAAQLHILWKQKGHNRTRKSQKNPVHTCHLFLQDPFEFAILSMFISSKWSFCFRFSHWPGMNFSSSLASHIPSPFLTHWFEHINNICTRLQIMTLLIMQFSPPPCEFLPLKHKYLPHTLFINIFYIILIIWRTHPRKTTHKIN